MTKAIRWLPGLIAAVSLGAAAPAQALGPVATMERQADPLAAPSLGLGWVGHAKEYALVRPSYKVIRGTRLKGTDCRFSGKVTGTPKRTSVEQRERAFNATGCLILLETGETPANLPREEQADRMGTATDMAVDSPVDEEFSGTAEAQELATEDAGEPILVDAGADGGSDGVCTPGTCKSGAKATGYSKWGLRTWYEDPAPLNIDVNSVHSYLHWSWEGPAGCVSAIQHARADYAWYTYTGWVKNKSNVRAGRDCNHAWNSTYAKFTNYPFCYAAFRIASTTRTYYDRTVLRGYTTGKATGNWKVYKKGKCAALLSFNHRVHVDRG